MCKRRIFFLRSDSSSARAAAGPRLLPPLGSRLLLVAAPSGRAVRVSRCRQGGLACLAGARIRGAGGRSGLRAKKIRAEKAEFMGKQFPAWQSLRSIRVTFTIVFLRLDVSLTHQCFQKKPHSPFLFPSQFFWHLDMLLSDS